MNTTTNTVILPTSSDPLRLACAGFLARYAGKTLDSYRIHLGAVVALVHPGRA
jgi:hypothetical protein